jgi:predicted NBD/HSP70 family sugar kinase
VSKGQLLRGADGYAGEVGHMIIGEAGYVEVTSLRGSFESYVGRQAVLARHRHHGGDAKSVRDFLDSLAASNGAAQATLADWAHHLGRGLASLAGILNPERIVLGCAVAALFAQAEQEVAASLQRHMPPGSRVPLVVLSSLGSDAPAIGAALMLHRDAFALDEQLVFQGSAPPDLDEAV